MRVAFVPRSTEIKPLFWRFVYQLFTLPKYASGGRLTWCIEHVFSCRLRCDSTRAYLLQISNTRVIPCQNFIGVWGVCEVCVRCVWGVCEVCVRCEVGVRWVWGVCVWEVWMCGCVDVWMCACVDVWMFVDVCGCVWMCVDVCGCVWMCMDVYGCVWMCEWMCEWVCEWVWMGVNGCEWVWMGVNGCGWVWMGVDVYYTPKKTLLTWLTVIVVKTLMVVFKIWKTKIESSSVCGVPLYT
jgi:hypothetical protein